MGQTHPQSPTYLYNYQYIASKTQQPYGFGKILQDTFTKEQIFQISMDSFNSNELLEIAQSIETKLHTIQSPFILKLVNWSEQDNGIINFYYEYCPKTLDREIQNKKKFKKRFNEQEILYLLYALTTVGCTLTNAKTAHKDIRPSNVLLMTNNEIKFAPVGTFPYDMDGQKKYLCFHEYSYLSPEMQNKSSTDWNASDVYAAGLTLLDTMSLTFSYDIIDEVDLNRKEVLIEKRLLALKQYYSQGLLLIVRKMLETQKDRRITFKDIENYLHPYSEQIKQLEKVDLKIVRKKHINQNSQISLQRYSSPSQLAPIQEFQKNQTSQANPRSFKRINKHFIQTQNTSSSSQLPQRSQVLCGTISPVNRTSVSPLANIKRFITPIKQNLSPHNKVQKVTVFNNKFNVSPIGGYKKDKLTYMNDRLDISGILSARNTRSPCVFSRNITPKISFSPSRKISVQRTTIPQSSYASKGKDESSMRYSEVDQLIDQTLQRAQLILREFGGNL